MWVSAQLLEEGDGGDIAEHVEAGDALALDQLQDCRHVHVALVVEHDLAATEQDGER